MICRTTLEVGVSTMRFHGDVSDATLKIMTMIADLVAIVFAPVVAAVVVVFEYR